MSARQIANLQGLRGIAASLVVLYHLQPALNRLYGTTLNSDFGVFGVDIFFILSGFVMFYSHPEPRLDGAPRFLIQRFFRIVPVYWLATLAIISLFLFGFRPVGLHQLSPTIAVQSLLFVPSTFPDGRHDLILTIGWTLMFELFFYLAFAMTFALRSLEKSFVALALLFGGLSLFGQVTGRLPYLLDFYTSPIMLEFLYGAAIAILYLRWWRATPPWLACAGLALFLAGFAVVAAFDAAGVGVPAKHGVRFLILGFPAFLVFAGALAMERGGWVLKNRWALELGAASYVLYLFHLVVLQAATKAVKTVLPDSPLVAAVIAVAACVLVAVVIHRAVESPILTWSKRLTRRRSTAARAPAPTLAVQAAE